MSYFSELKMICENQAAAERATPLGDSETACGAFGGMSSQQGSPKRE
jgi:hypothetical protein